MGGLVARSACHYAGRGGHPCAPLIRHVFCLGPRTSVPRWKKGVNATAWLAGLVPESRPLARLAKLRSAGVKDLRYGSLVEQDWRDCDPTSSCATAAPRCPSYRTPPTTSSAPR